MKFHHHTISFKHAIDGLIHAFRSQPNFRIHCLIALAVLIAGWLYQISNVEWALIIFTILWVLLSEMMNTAVESMVDLITNEYQEQARVAKDVAAGMVLLGALGSVIIGLIVFLPKL
jgi:diacylglycerol kinase